MTGRDSPVLAVITARGGSKGLPDKNLRPLAGRPLIAWTIAAAHGAASLDRVILSSDDPRIIAAAEAEGCEAPFARPAELAGDETSSIDVVLDAVDRIPGYEVVVLLQPTSPLRTASDIDAAVDLLTRSGAPACVSVTDSPVHPWLVHGCDGAGRLSALASSPPGASLRRQDLPPAWVLNGAVYVARIDWLRANRTFVKAGETAAYVMPPDRSVDIDTLADFIEAERLLSGTQVAAG